VFFFLWDLQCLAFSWALCFLLSFDPFSFSF
jgi:hypothetical protein